MKDPMQVLYEIVKPLASEIQVYKEAMTEDEESTPDSYLLLVSDVTNTGRVYGDGRTILRASDCDIKLISKGTADTTTSLHNINKSKITDLLNESGIDFLGVNLGFDDVSASTTYVWTVNLVYG